MCRKLASIQKIDALNPIDGADAIEVADILGWHVVVKKGEFKVGDMCIYCEVDSVLPDKPEFEFLRQHKFRIKTIKLKGQISQGICFPLDILPQQQPFNPVIGDDVTELLGIVKYEPPIAANLTGLVKGGFPGFLQKTDEIRIQSEPEILQHPDALKPVWYVTEKLDGTSFTAYFKNSEVGVCSRNLEQNIDCDSIYAQVAKKMGILEKLSELGRNIAIQGELIGPGIQKNKYGLRNHTIRFFNVFDIDAQARADYVNFKVIIELLGLETVPILDENFALLTTVDEIVEYSKAPSVFPSLGKREGVVIRHKMDDISFKVINPEHLLKYGG